LERKGHLPLLSYISPLKLVLILSTGVLVAINSSAIASSRTMDPALPQVDSNRLLPRVIDLRAQTNPQELFAKVPASTSTYASGFRSVTNLEFSNAINKVAWLLQGQLGKSKDFDTLAYIGPNDLRYSIVVIAAIKAGYKVRYTM
jgi:hypothetical protein